MFFNFMNGGNPLFCESIIKFIEEKSVHSVNLPWSKNKQALEIELAIFAAIAKCELEVN